MNPIVLFFNNYYPGTDDVIANFEEKGLLYVYTSRYSGQQFVIRPTLREGYSYECEWSSDGGSLIHYLRDWEKDPLLRLQVITGVETDPNNAAWECLEGFMKREKKIQQVCSLLDLSETDIRHNKFAFRFLPEQVNNILPAVKNFSYPYGCNSMSFLEHNVVVFEMSPFFNIINLPTFYDKLIYALKAAS